MTLASPIPDPREPSQAHSEASHPAPSESLIYTPPTILELLELSTLFPQRQPLEVELGSGDGSFLNQYAAQHPDRDFLGVERLLGRLRKLDKKARRAQLSNVRLIRLEAAYLTQFLLPPGSVSAFHIYFPDPWPKRKHRRHRLVQASFVSLAARALAPGGVVHLRTDDTDYFQQMIDVFGSSTDFTACETPSDLASIQTDFEREFQRRGIPTQRASYQKRTLPSGSAPLPP